MEKVVKILEKVAAVAAVVLNFIKAIAGAVSKPGQGDGPTPDAPDGPKGDAEGDDGDGVEQ